MSIEKKYAKLQNEYEQLIKKYSKIDRRFNSVMKMNDRFFRTFFERDIKAQRLYKRFNTIMKQSDKQSKHWLVETEKKESVIKQQSKMALMGEMMENIIHQMKQPLSLIYTASSSLELKKELDMLSDDEFEQYTSKIIDATHYLSDTIDSFRSFFKSKNVKENILLTNTIVKAKQLLETKFKGKDIKVVYELTDIKILGIENEFLQVVTNLLSNSIDALESNEKESTKVILINATIEDDNICINFIDSGGGVPEDIINEIFKIHFTTKEQNGSGVGLYMSKMIVENSFDGNISVENIKFNYEGNDLEGAKFSIKLPR